jgi:hypothetical protein
VIVRKRALDSSYPGGIDAFVRTPLANFVEDEHLVRVGFMSTGEASDLVEQLRANGLTSEDAAIVQGDAAPSWITVEPIDGRRCCWLRDEPPGDVVCASDDTFTLGLPLDAQTMIEEIVRRCGATRDGDRCIRGEANVELHVIENRPSSMHILHGRRDISRRQRFAADRSLLADLIATLTAAGARRL